MMSSKAQPKIRRFSATIVAALFAIFLPFSGLLAQAAPPPDPLSYADLADLSDRSPVIVHVRVKQAVKVDPARAIGLSPGNQRYFIVAETQKLIRGSNGVPGVIRYLVDIPLDSRGRAPKIKKQPFLVFARAAGEGELQLTAPDAQIRWSAARDSRVRAIVSELVQRDAAPPIRGISSAFHVPGTVIGEGETQLFLDTIDGSPVSITILSRQDQPKIWAVSLSEIVDEAAQAPVRGTLLWYRLACFLPRQIPGGAMSRIDAANAAQAQADYRLVIDNLGNCPRSRPPGGLPIRFW
jgi:hypothetical protein